LIIGSLDLEKYGKLCYDIRRIVPKANFTKEVLTVADQKDRLDPNDPEYAELVERILALSETGPHYWVDTGRYGELFSPTELRTISRFVPRVMKAQEFRRKSRYQLCKTFRDEEKILAARRALGIEPGSRPKPEWDIKRLPEDLQGPMTKALLASDPSTGFFAIGKAKLPKRILSELRWRQGIQGQNRSMHAIFVPYRHHLSTPEKRANLQAILDQPKVKEYLRELEKEFETEEKERIKSLKDGSRIPKEPRGGPHVWI
jgi:hypothetical protein